MRIFNIKVNGQPYEVEVEELAASDTYVKPQPVPMKSAAPVVNAAPAAKKTQPAVNVKGTELKAPMPGTVLDFKVKSGDTVKKGQAVLILEAMKMENEIAAPADGKVTIVAAKGAAVNTGDVLAVIA